MKDIKFRAYDKFAEKLMDEEDIGILPSNDTIGTTSYGNVTLINASNEYYVIIQYTGLKDKNGVEIYDSDIVEVDTTGLNYQPEIVKGVVKYIDGCFTVEFEKPVYDVVLKCNRERLYVKCFTGNKAIKVIGNIHEQESHT